METIEDTVIETIQPTKKPAKKSTTLAGMVAKKGKAEAVQLPSAEVVPIAAPVAAPVVVVAEIAAVVPVPVTGGQSYWKAMTFKLDQDTFIRLKVSGAKKNMTAQAIVMAALTKWLEENQ